MLNATCTFSNIEPGKLINDWNGSIHHINHREFILANNMSNIDDHIMNHDTLPMDEEYPFIMLAKEELDGFKESRTQKDCASAILTQVTFRKNILRNVIKYSFESNNGDLDSMSGSTDPASTLKENFTSCPSKVNFDPSSLEQRLSAVISDLESVNSDDFEAPLFYCGPEDFNLLLSLLSSLFQKKSPLKMILALLLILST